VPLTATAPNVVLASVPNCYLEFNSQIDYRNDSTPALRSLAFVYMEPFGTPGAATAIARVEGKLTLDVLTTALTGITPGTCTVTISQGGNPPAATTPTVLLATLVNCYLEFNTQLDYRDDSNPALRSEVFVYIEPAGSPGTARVEGKITMNVATSALAGFVSGSPCILQISQG
jgi:hypothetical protein